MKLRIRHVALCAFVLLASCGGTDEPAVEEQEVSTLRDVDDEVCISDSECSDGLFCNGAELCLPDEEDADAFGCIKARVTPICEDGIECTSDGCSNDLGRCEFLSPDEDGDGHRDAACEDEDGTSLGDDCDDDDNNRFPGNTEVCDHAHHDEDCNPETFGERDRDGDGEFDALCCNADGDDATCGTDCNDLSIAQRSLQPEFCDEIDNDCNGDVDDDVQAVAWYPDFDQDLYGTLVDDPEMSCVPVVGKSVLPTDCFDTEASQHPASLEICDFVDNDCDGLIDEPVFCEMGGGIEGSGGSGSGGNSGSGGAGTGGDESSGGTGSGGDATGGTGTGGTSAAGGAGAGGTGAGGTGAGGTGAGGFSGGSGVWPVLGTANCAGPMAGDNMLRKDGRVLHIATTNQSAIVDGTSGQPITGMQKVSSGQGYACGLRDTEEVWCWASTTSGNQYGQLGQGVVGGTTSPFLALPVRDTDDEVVAFGDVASIGDPHGSQAICAVDLAGQPWCWGYAINLVEGGGSYEPNPLPIVLDEGGTALDAVVTMSMSQMSGCAIRDMGPTNELWCWGACNSGECGNNSQAARPYPTKVLGVTDPQDVVVGNNYTCVLEGDRVKCFGANSAGQTGVNSATNYILNPTYVKDASDAQLSGVEQIFIKHVGGCALTGDAKLWCWGGSTINAAPLQKNATDVTDALWMTGRSIHHYGAYVTEAGGVEYLNSAGAVGNAYTVNCGSLE